MAQPVKYQGVDKESSGYKLLAAMGWQEGNGLVRLVALGSLTSVLTCGTPVDKLSYLQGARQQGIKEHVKVKKKHDSTGVGAVRSYIRQF